MAKRRPINVGNLPGPLAELCWKQNMKETRTFLSRCDRVKGHRGLHLYEFIDRLEAAGLMKPPRVKRPKVRA